MLGKNRSLGQILEKPYVHSRGHGFELKFMKLCQNDNLSSKRGYIKSKTRSLGKI